jgi:protein-tyrosine phosphatase
VVIRYQSGRSRSAAAVAGCLVTANGWTTDAAFELIRRRRKSALQGGLPDLVGPLQRG